MTAAKGEKGSSLEKSTPGSLFLRYNRRKKRVSLGENGEGRAFVISRFFLYFSVWQRRPKMHFFRVFCISLGKKEGSRLTPKLCPGKRERETEMIQQDDDVILFPVSSSPLFFFFPPFPII